MTKTSADAADYADATRSVVAEPGARNLLDGLELRELAARLHTELGETSRARQHASFERADARVVGPDSVGERLAERIEMLREGSEPRVELDSELANFRGALRELDLLPTVRDRFEQRDEARRCRENHVLAQRFVEQLGLFGERSRQELIARDEQDHELWRPLELRPIGLGRKLADSSRDDRCVTRKRYAPRGIARRFSRFEIGIERRLDVDDELPALGQMDDHVGPNRALGRRRVALCHEIAMLEHARELDEAA